MARKVSGQYTIQSTDTSEKAIDGSTPNGDVLRVKNTGSNDMYVGNAGSDSVSNSNGFVLSSDEKEAIRIDDFSEGGYADVYVYGTSGDALSWIVIA